MRTSIAVQKRKYENYSFTFNYTDARNVDQKPFLNELKTARGRDKSIMTFVEYVGRRVSKGDGTRQTLAYNNSFSRAKTHKPDTPLCMINGRTHLHQTFTSKKPSRVAFSRFRSRSLLRQRRQKNSTDFKNQTSKLPASRSSNATLELQWSPARNELTHTVCVSRERFKTSPLLINKLHTRSARPLSQKK